MWWLAFFFLLILGGALVAVSRRWEAQAGIPGGRLISVDLERRGRASPTLVDEGLGLTGRPDLLLGTRRGCVPVEIKSGPAPARPYASHVLQLAAYCRLVEASYGRRPPYGVLQYADRGYALPYTRALETNLRRMIDRICTQTGALPDRSHAEANRCMACGYQSACDQRLVTRPGGGGGWV